MNQRIIAFWRHDQYPYVLGAEVLTIHSEGFECKGFEGFFVKPEKILPYKQGLELLNRLKVLQTNRTLELIRLKNEWDQKAAEVFGAWKSM